MSEQELRAKYNIPACYRYYGQFKGSDVFILCDSDITVFPDGRCYETHMGLTTGDEHCFVTSKWPEEIQ
jgi:hypothetical protein